MRRPRLYLDNADSGIEANNDHLFGQGSGLVVDPDMHGVVHGHDNEDVIYKCLASRMLQTLDHEEALRRTVIRASQADARSFKTHQLLAVNSENARKHNNRNQDSLQSKAGKLKKSPIESSIQNLRYINIKNHLNDGWLDGASNAFSPPARVNGVRNTLPVSSSMSLAGVGHLGYLREAGYRYDDNGETVRNLLNDISGSPARIKALAPAATSKSAIKPAMRPIESSLRLKLDVSPG